MALITCTNAAFAYDGKVVVEHVDVTLNPGDYLCIVGENGSGKSTLVKGLLRLKAPQEGKVLLGDGLKPGQVGYLPQATAAQKDFPASVQEVVRSGCLARHGALPRYTAAERARAQHCMRLLGVTALRRRCFRELSGGQQRRVLLARALCACEKLLLLDEPLAGLDPLAGAELYQRIDELRRGTGLAVVMVSHDISGAARHATHILHLAGRPLFYGSAADYFATDLGRAFQDGARKGDETAC